MVGLYLSVFCNPKPVGKVVKYVIHLPHVHLSEVQNRVGGVGSKHSCDGISCAEVELEEGLVGEGDVDRGAARAWEAGSIQLFRPTRCHRKPGGNWNEVKLFLESLACF